MKWWQWVKFEVLNDNYCSGDGGGGGGGTII